MKKSVYVYKAALSEGEMLLANDSSSFSSPYFLKASEKLTSLSSLPYSSDCLFYPLGRQEDEVFSRLRTSFRLGDWLLPALIVNVSDDLESVILIERAHPERALVYSFGDKSVAVACYDGFLIEEEGEAMSGKEFLSTLSFASPSPSFSPLRNDKPVNLSSGYSLPIDEQISEEDEEGQLHIDVPSPSFEPSSKKGRVNLGASPHFLIDEEDDDEEVSVDIKKDDFAPSSSKKPRNLSPTLTFVKKKTPVNGSLQESVPSSNDAPSFVLPAFEANSKKAKRVIADSPSQKVWDKKKQEDRLGEKPVEPSFVKPAFEPNSNARPSQRSLQKEDPYVPNQRKYGARINKKKDDSELISSSPKEEIYVFGAFSSPDYARTIINDPSLMFVAKKFQREGQKTFGVAPQGIDSSTTRFFDVPDDKKESLFALALYPTIDAWDLLAMAVENNGMPIAYLLSFKEDHLLTAAYEIKGQGLFLVALSHNGAAIEDPSLDYPSLRSLCFPSEKA
jgi:hypothetical protein